jgi:hypothetical protein
MSFKFNVSLALLRSLISLLLMLLLGFDVALCDSMADDAEDDNPVDDGCVVVIEGVVLGVAVEGTVGMVKGEVDTVDDTTAPDTATGTPQAVTELDCSCAILFLTVAGLSVQSWSRASIAAAVLVSSLARLPPTEATA